MEVEHTAKPAARQRLKAHGKDLLTATLAQRTAKPVRTAKPLPCDFRAAHGKDGFAGRVIAEQSLPCKPARQRLCRAYFGLCRAFRLHGKAQFCRSASWEDHMFKTKEISNKLALQVINPTWKEDIYKWRRKVSAVPMGMKIFSPYILFDMLNAQCNISYVPLTRLYH
jgi:hypothetical protein